MMMPKGFIELRGVRVNNLRNVSLRIPRGEMVVLTGLSGSGKSSLAFGTLYAEGQRRYVQSLSAYARQFLSRLPKPDADFIGGIPPAIVIEQKVSTRSPRSTVGTASEIYDYLRLLYARVGRIYSPEDGHEIRVKTPQEMVDFVVGQAGKRVVVLAPIVAEDGQARMVLLDLLAMEGFSRVQRGDEVCYIETPEQRNALAKEGGELALLVDRFVPEDTEEFRSRCAESLEIAGRQGEDSYELRVYSPDGTYERHVHSGRMEINGMPLPQLSPALFSFNSPLGACPECEGYGKTVGIDEDLVIPDKSRSVFDNAVVCWKGSTMGAVRDDFIRVAAPLGFPVHKPYYQLSEAHKRMLWEGVPGAMGINDFFAEIASYKYKIQFRVMLARYSGKAVCRVCHGKRLREEATWVRVGGRSITDLMEMPLVRLAEHFAALELGEHDQTIASRLLHEIRTRLSYLLDVGLGYLTLGRTANTLSGGETQRIHLASALGSSLVGSLYILDEPSVGLHSVDTQRLIGVLRKLRDLGNTVLVVEHDEEIIRAADTVIDMGPGAGSFGGNVVCMGTVADVEACHESLTGKYLSGQERIPKVSVRREGMGEISVGGMFVNNLEDVSVRIPLCAMTVVSGVSGSGKSSLVREGIVPAVQSLIDGERPAHCCFHDVEITGGTLYGVEYVDQDPLSRSSRSTPITYIKAYDLVRQLMAAQPAAVSLELQPGSFSFNAPGGRCEVCEGAGVVVMPMQFMADVEVVCEECHGTRFRREVLDVQYRGKNIDDILRMTVTDAIAFFREADQPQARRIAESIQILEDVGLGYVTLGQSTSTLSGGESQRLKLASYIMDPHLDRPMLFAFDEPTTGLHFHDIRCLMGAFDRLIQKGHTLLIVEHNVEVIRLADWLIDMGPGAGEHGGRVVASGTPEMVARCEESVTARYFRDRL